MRFFFLFFNKGTRSDKQVANEVGGGGGGVFARHNSIVGNLFHLEFGSGLVMVSGYTGHSSPLIEWVKCSRYYNPLLDIHEPKMTSAW